jgi:hypothetical protein
MEYTRFLRGVSADAGVSMRTLRQGALAVLEGEGVGRSRFSALFLVDAAGEERSDFRP